MRPLSLTAYYNILRFVSCGIFLISLTQHSFSIDNVPSDSIANLISGFFGIFLDSATFSWFANPFLVLSWFTIFTNKKASLWLAVAAVLVMLSFLFCKNIIKDEAGNYGVITAYHLGYWLWIASASVMVIGLLNASFMEWPVEKDSIDKK